LHTQENADFKSKMGMFPPQFGHMGRFKAVSPIKITSSGSVEEIKNGVKGKISEESSDIQDINDYIDN